MGLLLAKSCLLVSNVFARWRSSHCIIIFGSVRCLSWAFSRLVDKHLDQPLVLFQPQQLFFFFSMVMCCGSSFLETFPFTSLASSSLSISNYRPNPSLREYSQGFQLPGFKRKFCQGNSNGLMNERAGNIIHEI